MGNYWVHSRGIFPRQASGLRRPFASWAVLAPGSPTNATPGRIFAPNLRRGNLQFATLRARIEQEAKFWRLCVAQLVGVELLLEVTVRS
jgi:hypothetical protein